MPTRSVHSCLPVSLSCEPAAGPEAAQALVRDLPRDQAMGLRLIALARVAAAMHLSETASDVGVRPSAAGIDVARTQAAGLVGGLRR